MRRLASCLAFLAVVPGSAGVATAADEQGPAPEAASARPNRPPKPVRGLVVEPPLPDSTWGAETLLRSGRTARVTFRAEDPDGDPLTYAVHPLPPGASFDKEEGVLTWRPAREHEGEHELTFEVTDGRLVAKQASLVVVRKNRPPSGTLDSPGFRTTHPRGPLPETSVVAQDLDADPVTFEVRKKPARAELFAARGSVYLVWSPTEADVGEHTIVLDVSDGELRTTVTSTIIVLPRWSAKDYRGWLLLGGGPSGFVTHGDGELLIGGAFDATLVALREDGLSGYNCAHRTRVHDCHARYHRFYGDFEVLDSTRAGAPSLFTYAAGYSAGFEWSPERRHLIPHYGVELGGLVRSGVGHRAQVNPYLGLHLWADDALWINATAGYRVVPAGLHDLSGPTFALRVIVNPW